MTLEVLIETQNQGDIAVIKSLLDSEGIAYLIQGEEFNVLRPLVGVARVMVAADRLEEARDLISVLDLTLLPFSTAGYSTEDDSDDVQPG